MRRFSLITVSILGLALCGQVWAARVPTPNEKLNLRAIDSSQCTSNTVAKQVVDVTFTLDNYADSGYLGAWALDTVHRHLRIWKQTGGGFCAQIADNGSSFVTLAAYGPVGGAYLPAGIQGTFDGGYIIADIVGKYAPQYKTSGDLGTFDAKCDADDNCTGSYPGWISFFKHVTGGGFSAWGWLYNAGPHGAWLDQLDVFPPNGGDII